MSLSVKETHEFIPCREKLKKAPLEPVKNVPIGKYSSELLKAKRQISELSEENNKLVSQLANAMDQVCTADSICLSTMTLNHSLISFSLYKCNR